MRIPREWKTPRLMLGLFIFEFLGTVAALALFGIAAPDEWRSTLWKDGALNGFNSDPNQILYAYANYRPIPKIPIVWSSFITNYNVVVSVLSMFFLLIKSTLWVMHLFWPILSLLLHVVLTALWAFSVYGQAGPDYSDPAHPSSIAWYVAKPCSVVHDKANTHGCQMAKASFAVTIIMLAIFAVHIPVSIFSLIRSKGGRHSRNESDDSQTGMTDSSPDDEQEYYKKHWELSPVPQQPAQTPATPRTQAFNTLNQPLPLRGGRKDRR
ncbi:MAG: hypothetical protein M1825_005632 [Sarcosagium campestre]|nr:MAG: hypothetical protein M1825_005632 [Sarcosagium campestre]